MTDRIAHGVLLALMFVIAARAAHAQPQAKPLRIEVVSESRPVDGASVLVNGEAYTTGPSGVLIVSVAPGLVDIVVTKEGFAAESASMRVEEGVGHAVLVELHPAIEEVVTVSATRTGGRLEDQPMRVEVLDREEIEEKLLMTPGDIVMMLNEMGGMRVQATSPSLGAASVRIQGMRGRYTRFLSDGLPLFGEQVGAIGLLQIPPMDLRQVEVIKGVASSLYGAGAMGGVVNLVSRRPPREPEREVLINQTTRGGTDGVLWYATPLSAGWGMTLLGGLHGQRRTDVGGDGWADLPSYARAVLRPRLFWDDGGGNSLFVTAGFTGEDRRGGTMSEARLPATGLPYAEALDTRRVDAGIVLQRMIQGSYVLTARASLASQRHDHRFGEVREDDRHRTSFGELAVRGGSGRHVWAGGVAIERESYEPFELPQFRFTYTVPGMFAEEDLTLLPWISVSASARVDWHNEYGTFASPRISALVRGGRWNSRLSAGTGFFASSPLTEETEAAGLSRLRIPRPLEAERGRSASLDVSRTDGPASYSLTLFTSRVRRPLHVDRREDFALTNLSSPTNNAGLEVLATVRREPIAVTGTYAYVRSTESIDGVRARVPLTPRHSAGVVAMWEKDGVGRVGVETYYTGEQRLEENPYREFSRPYVIVGLLVERQLGSFRLFINGENLTGVRQTRWDPLLRPNRAPDGRWTVDAWAPLEGRNINGGVRVRL